MRLTGKVSIVTGASAGLGAAVAARFAREGSRVVFADTKENEGVALVDRLRSEGFEADFVRTDISDEDSVKHLVASTVDRYEHVDVLYNNAAILLADLDMPAHEISTETWDQI